MLSASDPSTLENLFIEKFLERYKLNERDLKRAFSKFDKDNNGLLDLDELKVGISMFLNGVKDDDVRNLIAKYDLNKDGKISYNELLHLLTTRKATKKSNKSSPPKHRSNDVKKPLVVEPTSPSTVFRSDAGSDIYSYNDDDDIDSKRLGSSYSDRFSAIAPSELESVIDYNNPRELEYRTKMALQSIHTVLLRRATAMRTHGTIPHRLTMTSNQLMEKLACGFLVESFKPYMIGAGNGNRESGVTFGNFYDVLRTYVAPGSSPLRQEVAQFLFTLCQTSPDSNPPVTNPNELASLIFGTASSPKNGARLRRVTDNQPSSPKAKKETTFYAKVDQGRPPIARGPLKIAEETYEINRPDGLVTVPLRFLSRKSRTALTAPSNFDVNLYKRSSTAPGLFFFREFVYGMSSTNHTSNQFFAIPAASASNRSTGTTVVYASAGLGIVHDLASNSQQYFEGHNNDITCITMSSDGTLAATGCMNKKPIIHIWQTNDTTAPVSTIKFFERFIVGLAFTFDAKFLCAIGADDAHTMAVFDVLTGLMLCVTTAQHGLPPQIKSMCFSSAQQYTEHITKEHNCPCDVLVTAGEHHLRFWSFRRPTTVGTGPETGASILFKGVFFGKMQVKAPKVYTSCGFIANQDKSFDVVTGGSNGIVYLWRKGVCAAFTQAIRGGVNCIQVVGDKVFCGGAKSIMKVLDGRTLDTIYSYTLDLAALSDSSASITPRPRSAGSKGYSPRPGSAISKQSNNTDNAEADANATGITSIVVLEPTARGTKSIIPILVTTTMGMMIRINASASILTAMSAAITVDATSNILFHYHTNDVWALSTDRTGRLIATGGNDGNLFVWDSTTKSLISRVNTSSHVKCCAFDRTSSLIAIGTSNGSVTVFYLSDIAKNEFKKSNCMKKLIEAATRKDAKEGFNDIKFSPNNEYIAGASTDNNIYIYSCQWDADRKTCILRQKAVLRGHSSFVTHIDWSIDSKLLQSTCAAYELLCWDIEKGKLYSGLNMHDIKWKTNTCILGFNVMGIWPPYSDGTDINAIDVHKDSNGKGIIVTATDSDKVQAFNYPCVVKNAPSVNANGHSSFVTNIKFINRVKEDNPLRVVSIGGKDATVIQSTLIEKTVKATYNYTTSL